MRVIAFRHVKLYDHNQSPPRLLFDGIIREVTEYWGCLNPECTCNYKVSLTYMTDAFRKEE